MNSYNFRQIDKSIKPVSENITKTVQTCPNLIKLFFSSVDAIFPVAGNNTPSFNVPSSIFHKFDPNRPVYCMLEFLYNASGSQPTTLYNLVWLNMPSSNATWYTNNTYKNILGSFRINGTASSLNTRYMPYMLDLNSLLSMSVYQFAFVSWDHNLLGTANTTNYLFSLCFYQD